MCGLRCVREGAHRHAGTRPHATRHTAHTDACMHAHAALASPTQTPHSHACTPALQVSCHAWHGEVKGQWRTSATVPGVTPRHFFFPLELSFGSVQVRHISQRLAGGRPGPQGFLARRGPDSSPARACLAAAGIVGGQCGHWVWGSRAQASVQYVGANAQRGVALRAFRLNCPRRGRFP